MMAIKSHISKTISMQALTENKVSSIRLSDYKRQSSYSDKPTPLDFEAFIPWVCKEWQVPEAVTVVRIAQDKHIRNHRRSSSARAKPIKSVRMKEEEESVIKRTTPPPKAVTSSTFDNAIPIKAFYDSHSHLAEIAIESCVSALHRKVIQAISLCLPFHAFLTKLVIRKGGLNHILVYEISKFLPHSNLTDICLDDTNVPEGNYYVLLDHASNLKYLSLSRCKINDRVCKELAIRIDFGCPAEKSLAILDLSTNLITDNGANYLGDVLRKNRHLLHLNLSGNRIGDTGLHYLMRHLQEFPLTYSEILDKKSRSFQYCKRRSQLYERYCEEIAHLRNSESESFPADKRVSKTTKQTNVKKLKKFTHHSFDPEPLSKVDLAEKMTKEILGELNDPFEDVHCVRKDEYCYSTGNLKFCFLNIAYNNIEFNSLLKILNVLEYQSMIDKSNKNTGLLRIVLDGNYFPDSCPELKKIDEYLKKAMESQIPIHVPHSPILKRRASLHLPKHK